MNCPECGSKGYSRKTKTPEWRCRKCRHEWDVSQTNFSLALANSPFYIEATDLVCDCQGTNRCEHTDLCTKPLVIKTSRFGRFMECAGFPECRNIKPTDQRKSTGVPCPKPDCDGDIIDRSAGRRTRLRPFFRCSNYPACDLNLRQYPLNNPCPECGGLMTQKGNDPVFECFDYPACDVRLDFQQFVISPIVERFLYSIGKNEGDIRYITLEFALENLRRNYDEAELLQILGKDDWSELESGDLGGYMYNLSVVFRNDGCLIVAEHILKEGLPTGLNLGDVLEVKHFSDDNYALIRIIERGDLVLRYLTVDERDEISGYRRSTAVEEERKEKERQTAADLERTERQAAADLKRSQSEGKLLDNGAEKRGFPEGLLAAVQIGSIGGVIAVVVGILFITGVFSGDETAEARFTPSPTVGKDVERLLAEIETFTNAFGQSFGPFVVTGNAECLDCDLRGADLKYALMAWFDLSGSDFSGADLYFASFSGANLSGANFSGANLKYAGFKNANLSGANLDNVFDAQGIGEAYRSTIPNKYRYDPKKENWVSKD